MWRWPRLLRFAAHPVFLSAYGALLMRRSLGAVEFRIVRECHAPQCRVSCSSNCPPPGSAFIEPPLILCTSAATIGTLIAVVIAYMTFPQAISWRRALRFSWPPLPVAVPASFSASAVPGFPHVPRPPFLLYGTLWILLIAFITISASGLPTSNCRRRSGWSIRTSRGEHSFWGRTRLVTRGRITSHGAAVAYQ